MFDSALPDFVEISRAPDNSQVAKKRDRAFFWAVKRCYDVVLCTFLLLPLLFFSLVLIVLNRFFNRGTLFYVQKRMGKNCIPFSAIKFRSMAAAPTIKRGPEDPIEQHRISAFGRLLRKSHVDELPQILNVLSGRMSLIGPRPDFYDHALIYLDIVPGYGNRFSVRPGISGLAQVVVGYVDESEGIARKVAADVAYIERVDYKLEGWIVLKTLKTIITLGGA